MRRRRWSTAPLLVAVLALAAAPAIAHPLGNFTINHYAAIDARPDGLALSFVLDMAEIPTFQEIGLLDEAQMTRHLTARLPEWAHALRLTGSGVPVPLSLHAARIKCLPGAGGLPILRVEEDLWARLGALGARGAAPGSSIHFVYRDTNFPARVGWKEIVVTGREVEASSVPAIDRGSDRLRSYPVDLLALPPDDTEARFTVRRYDPGEIRPGSSPTTPSVSLDLPGCRSAAPATTGPAGVPPSGHGYAAESTAFGILFTRVTGGPPDIRILAVALAAALILGAYHALTPGHGKTILATYFIGSRGTPIQAVLLGSVVTLTHTSGVFLLGFVTLAVSRYIVPEQLYPGLSMLSGLMLVCVGISLLRRRLASLKGAHGHEGAHASHRAHHAHRPGNHSHHDRGHARWLHHDRVQGEAHERHTHLSSGEPLRARDLITLGVTGGLLPCPSALVVMLAAISAGHIIFGLALITAFSLGLAGVLVVGGMAMVYGRTFVTRRLERRAQFRAPSKWQRVVDATLPRVPVFSAAAVALLGVVMIVQTVATTWLAR